MKHFGKVTLAVLLLSCSWANAKDLTKVTLAQFGKERMMLYLPIYVAMEEGYFKEQGQEINLVFSGTSDSVFATVISGNADFGIADPAFTAISTEKGLPAKTIATFVQKIPVFGYTADKNMAPIENLDQLQGKKIGVYPAPTTAYTLLKNLVTDNKLKDVTLVESPIGSQTGLLQAGKVDLATDMEPAFSIALSKGYRKVFSLPQFTPPQAITGVMATQQHLDADPAMAFKFVAALQKGLSAIQKDKQIAYRVAIKLFPNLEASVVKHAVDQMIDDHAYTKTVVINSEQWQHTLAARLKTGELKKPQATSAATDNRFAEKAQQGK